MVFLEQPIASPGFALKLAIEVFTELAPRPIQSIICYVHVSSVCCDVQLHREYPLDIPYVSGNVGVTKNTAICQ